MTQTRRSPGAESRATSTPPSATAKNTAPGTDFDFDKSIVDAVDKSIWEAVFDGHFRLAVRCDVCGRWLTAGKSKRAHRGPRCAAKAVADV